MNRVSLYVIVIVSSLSVPAAAQTGNILTNPGFETGTGSWTFYTNASGSYASVSPGFTGARAARLTMNSVGSNVQLYQSGLRLEPNTSYTLTFSAYSNNARDVSLTVMKQTSPYTTYGLSNRFVNLTNSWQTYTIEFTTSGFSGVVNDARVRFWFAPYATSGTVYYIDDVELKKTAPTVLPPLITTQPISRSVPEGDGVTFSVSATGTLPLQYVWVRNGVDIVGGNSATLNIPITNASDSGAIFHCIITNIAGADTSESATLSVVASAPIVVQNPLNRVVLIGQSAAFMVGTIGTPPFEYQWQKNGNDIPEGISASLLTAPTIPDDDGAAFRCIVTNALGRDTSAIGVLTIGELPEIVTQPLNLNVNDGQQTGFSVTADGTAPLQFQWLRNGTAVAGAVEAGYAFTPSMADSGAMMRCVVTNALGSDTSDAAVLTVHGVSPTVTANPGQQIVAQGQSASFSVSATGTGSLTYQWQKNGATIPGATGSTYTTPQTVISDSGAVFRCVVSNYVGSDTSGPAVLRVTRGTIIQIWYGNQQTFGSIGDPTPDINILGNVTSSKGIKELHYSLNGGTFKTLSRGPDTRRLVAKGDFNVDLPYTSLTNGLNRVVIRARDSVNVLAFDTVRVTYVAGNSWPGNYDINWSAVSNLPNVAQVLDGSWRIDDATGSLRPIQIGYDRLVAIGEHSWKNYEVTVPITINRIDSSGYAPPSNGAGVGFLLRWPGHSNSPASTAGLQPKTGYLPLGALAWYSYRTGTENLVIAGNNLQTLASDNTGRKLVKGVRYIFKARVETLQGGIPRYSIKVWADSLSEPVNWDLIGQAAPTDPQQGCLLLVAHHVDASFGDVMVRSVTNSRFTLAVNATGNGNVTVNPIMPDYLKGQLVTLTAVPGSGAQFQNWSGDLVGNTNPVTISMDTNKIIGASFISGGTPSTIVSDNFNAPSLNTGLWTVVNPRGDATFSLTGTQLAVTVPAGISHDVWTSGNYAPRIMQSANNVDFEVEARFQSIMDMKSQLQGIIVQQDQGNFIRFDFVRGGTSIRAFAATFANGVPTTRKDLTITSSNTLYLRVRRDGNTWTQRYSYNGTDWTTSVTFQHPLVVNAIGPFFGNAGSPVPIFNGLIDYFFNTAVPPPSTGTLAGDAEEDDATVIPVSYALHQNYPNPFNPSTTITFDLPEPASVSLKVYDMLGREIHTLAEGMYAAGRNDVAWHTGDIMSSSGVYAYRIVATGASGRAFVAHQKMILLK